MIRIGTSGWQYKQWNDSFYPAEVKGKQQLPYFAGRFNTVEINSTFYRIPSVDAAKNWLNSTPGDFVFAVKLNRYLTHRKRLIIDSAGRERLDLFLKAIKPLAPKTGAILVQLPPSFESSLERLDRFLALLHKRLDPETAIACEFRHGSWFNSELYDVLRRRNAGLVIAAYPGKFSGDYPVVNEVVYIRYHATPEHPDYSEDELDKWVSYIKSLDNVKKRIYIYFNNDFEAWAIKNAKYLNSKLGA